jgi:hypothetical protein
MFSKEDKDVGCLFIMKNDCLGTLKCFWMQKSLTWEESPELSVGETNKGEKMEVMRSLE